MASDRRRVLLVALVALLAAGCGEREEPLAAEVPLYPVSATGADGETIVVEARPERVVALAPGAAELVGALGAGDRLAGVPARTNVPGAQGAPIVTRPSGLVETSAVVALEPDLILAATTTNRDALETAARRTRAAVYVQPDRSIREVVRAVHDLGFLLGDPARARSFAVSLREEIAAVDGAVGPLEPVRVFVDLGLFISPPSDSLVADLVRRAGGTPVGTENAGAPADPCDVVALRPDVVLRVRDTVAALPGPRLACGGRPYAGGRIESVSSPLVRPGPRIGEALDRIARLLHPDAFD